MPSTLGLYHKLYESYILEILNSVIFLGKILIFLKGGSTHGWI